MEKISVKIWDAGQLVGEDVDTAISVLNARHGKPVEITIKFTSGNRHTLHLSLQGASELAESINAAIAKAKAAA